MCYIHFDPAGKNQKLQNVLRVAIRQYCSRWVSSLHHMTPLNNSHAELAFLLAEKVCAIMEGALVPHELFAKVVLDAIA